MALNFSSVEFETSFGNTGQFEESDDMELVFSGRSNVGKSSLINSVFNRKNLARTSSQPGKTATINFFRVDGGVVFVDLPGYGYAKVSKSERGKWSELIDGYFSSERNIVLVTLLIDSRHKPSELDISMIYTLVESEIPFIVALTKIDKLKKKEYEERMESLKTELPYYEDIRIVETSSETGQGINELKKIYNYVTEDE